MLLPTPELCRAGLELCWELSLPLGCLSALFQPRAAWDSESLEVLAVMLWLTGQGKGLQTWILAAPGMTQRELSGQCRALQSPVIFKDDP